jgi:hypothetical protein
MRERLPSKLSLSDAQHAASERGGVCLSLAYTGVEQKLEWQCSEGHRFKLSLHHIHSMGCWCRTCGYVRNSAAHRLTLDDAHLIATNNGGKCLSTLYVKAIARLEWECESGHRFKASLNSVRNMGSWCPSCLHKKEAACRKEIEHQTGRQFPPASPIWLINSRGGRMRLDGYSLEIQTAFEYQGEQHYIRVPKWQPTEAHLEWLQQRDREKQSLCAVNQVKLIVIPYWESKNLRDFIKKALDLQPTAV